jgi:filamentous hemagglutinin family protein
MAMTLRQWLQLTSAIIPLSWAMTGRALAAPQNGTVVGGQATISQQGTRTNILQSTAKAIINWQGFSTAANESVQFSQPSSQSVVLNRVTGSGPSTLYGQLTANGQVWLVNPNGVLIGPSGSVNVGAFLATTSSIADADFLAGRYSFSGAPDGSSVINQGAISTANGGSVILSAPTVQNSGSIRAPLGSVALGAAQGFTVDIDGDGLLHYQIGDAAAQALVTNTGSVSTPGGTVLLAARMTETANREVINTTGLIEADSVAVKDGEVIFDGGSQGIVTIGGQVSAGGLNPGETGGAVSVAGNQIVLAGATIDASGQAGGGSIAVGSWQATATSVDAQTRLAASATVLGKGGAISVVGGQATVLGTLLAQGGPQGGDGGTVETSAGVLAVGGAMVNVGAPKGKSGNWLLDPYDITIDSGLANSIDQALVTGNVTVQATGSGASATGSSGSLSGGSINPSGNGDINVNYPITWSTDTTLELDAYRNINVNANIAASGNNAQLILKTSLNTDGVLGGVVLNGASVALTGTNPTLAMCDGGGVSASCAAVPTSPPTLTATPLTTASPTTAAPTTAAPTTAAPTTAAPTTAAPTTAAPTTAAPTTAAPTTAAPTTAAPTTAAPTTAAPTTAAPTTAAPTTAAPTTAAPTTAAPTTAAPTTAAPTTAAPTTAAPTIQSTSSPIPDGPPMPTFLPTATPSTTPAPTAASPDGGATVQQVLNATIQQGDTSATTSGVTAQSTAAAPILTVSGQGGSFQGLQGGSAASLSGATPVASAGSGGGTSGSAQGQAGSAVQSASAGQTASDASPTPGTSAGSGGVMPGSPGAQAALGSLLGDAASQSMSIDADIPDLLSLTNPVDAQDDQDAAKYRFSVMGNKGLW